MANSIKPGLFGINKSNRDFSSKESWGKNQFNSSFPAALACYFHSKNLNAVYLKSDKDMNIVKSSISIQDLFGIDPLCSDTYYSFETQYTPFQKYVIRSIPRNDLVILKQGQCISSLEIKLVALPDNQTSDLSEEEYGSEIVVRPDTIIYLACSIIQSLEDDDVKLKNILGDIGKDVSDWTIGSHVLPVIKDIHSGIKKIVELCHKKQVPVIMQPVWKTVGKSSHLADNCLDIFVWSNLGMLKLFMPSEDAAINKITRHTRTMIWLVRMLEEYSRKRNFDGQKIIDELSYGVKNDKAFASGGKVTHPLMMCSELLKPRIRKTEIKNIILGGGQYLLSPERRFDAIIVNSPDLFV